MKILVTDSLAPEGLEVFQKADGFEVDVKLGLKPDERIAGFVHIGTAKETPADRDRPALDDIVTRF